MLQKTRKESFSRLVMHMLWGSKNNMNEKGVYFRLLRNQRYANVWLLALAMETMWIHSSRTYSINTFTVGRHMTFRLLGNHSKVVLILVVSRIL